VLHHIAAWVGQSIEHPDIRYVVYPVHLDGTPTGQQPRLRHDPDCSHFEWGGGERLGMPVLATEEQMGTLAACKTCVETRYGSASGSAASRSEGRIGAVCPACHQVMSLSGVCDNCG
jgi:hypothetical protein